MMPKFLGGIVGLVFWLLSGGAMTIHLAHSVFWIENYIFAIVGFFIAPIGVVNGLYILFTGLSLVTLF
jgi:hypothetical protein